MKVVINTCFGGYGLSIEAMKQLIKLKSPAIEKSEGVEYCGSKERYIKTIKEDFTEDAGDGYLCQKWCSTLFRDGYFYNASRDARDDPKLISVVKKLGKKANGSHAQLKIITIPDGIEYTIEEYDGTEHIAEVHKTWY